MRNKKDSIKLYILSGFLGAGKTTLLKALLEDTKANGKTGVIMNEFGKVGIDGSRIMKNGIELIEINNGSVFCSCLKGSFIKGLVAFSELDIDNLFIEGSGLSDPGNMLEILRQVEKMSGRNHFDYRGSICIVDAAHFSDYLELFPVMEKQIAHSSLLVINKIDLVTSETATEMERTIRMIQPDASVLKTSYCKFNFLELDDWLDKNVVNVLADSSNTVENRPRTFTLKANGVFEKEAVIDFLKSLRSHAYRIKGAICLKEGWHELDLVGRKIDLVHQRHEYEISQIVIISNEGAKIVPVIITNWEKRFKTKMILR